MRFPFAVFASFAVGFYCSGVVAAAAGSALNQASLRKAVLLSDAHHYVEAAVIYEEQLKLEPENPDLLVRLANALFMQGQIEPDIEKAKSLNRRVRALAEQAQKLGSTDPLSPLLVAGIHPDGSTVKADKGSFSKREEVDELIHQGEVAFSHQNFKKAVECYQRAFQLEPTNYHAALWTGDAYFSDRQLQPACDWFRKAIAVSPDTETAHRYLGDALNRLGLGEEAFKEWVAALLCEPYQRLTQQHFTPQMRAAAESRGHLIPQFPAMHSRIEGKKIILAVKPDDGVLLMAYNLCAVGWRSEKFAERFPNEKTPRRSLPEEIQAIDAMIEMAEADKKPDQAEQKKWQPVIDGLIALKREGLLEAYVLFDRADEGVAKDYATYRAQHRDQLQRYIWVYWCGFE